MHGIGKFGVANTACMEYFDFSRCSLACYVHKGDFPELPLEYDLKYDTFGFQCVSMLPELSCAQTADGHGVSHPGRIRENQFLWLVDRR